MPQSMASSTLITRVAAAGIALAATGAQAHETMADHAVLAQDSVLGALAHRLFGQHHMIETIGLVGLGLGIAAAAVLVVAARRRS